MDFGIQPGATSAAGSQQQANRSDKANANKAKSREVSADKPEATEKVKADTPTTNQVHESQKTQSQEKNRGDNNSLDMIV